MFKRFLSGMSALVVGLVISTHAATLTVPGDYSTIQAAIDAAAAGDTVSVGAGTYNENLTIDKALTLQSSSGAASTTITGSGGSAVTVAADNVTINGFTMTNPNGKYAVTAIDYSHLLITSNIVTAVGNSTDSGGYVHAIAVVSSVSAVDDVMIVDNVISNIAAAGVDGTGKGYSASAISVGWSTGDEEITGLKIERNTISDVKADTSAWPVGHGAYGILLNHGTGTTGKTSDARVCDNEISDLEGLWAHAIGLEGYTPGAIVCGNVINNIVDHKSPSDPDAVGVMIEDNSGVDTVTIVSNSFVDVWLGVRNKESTSVEASANYWGAAIPDLTGLTSGPTSIDTYYADAALTQLQSMNVFVDDDFNAATSGWGVDHFAAIQDGINATAVSGTVNVAAGTYVENITIAKSLALLGSGSGTLVYPAASDVGGTTPDSGPSFKGSQMIVVEADDVEISNLTLDGDNPSLTSGVVRNGADLDARNGIIENYNTGTYNNLEVHHCTVKNVYLRGIYAASHGTGFYFHDNTVRNVAGGNSSLGMMAFYGSGTFASNLLINASAMSANNSASMTVVGNVLSNCVSGLHLDNSTAASVIQGNRVVDGGGNSWAVWAFNPGAPITITDNVVSNCDVGIAAVAGNENLVTINRNDLDCGTPRSNTQGIIITDALSWWGWGDAPCSSTVSNNLIRNFETGIYVHKASTSVTAVASCNSIEGGAYFYGTGATLYDFSANWWGTSTPASVAGQIGGSSAVDYTPWLTSSTDTSTDQGFQGDFATLWADDDSPQSGTIGRIQEAVEYVSVAGTVNVEAGTYTELLSIDKPLTLNGPNAGINPNTQSRETEAIVYYPAGLTNGWRTLVDVQSDDVTIDGFSINDTNGAAIPWSTGIGINERNNTLVQNNIVEGFNYGPIWAYNWDTSSTTPVDGTQIIDNHVLNNHGALDSIYLVLTGGTVSGNVVEASIAGIQIQPYSQTNGGIVISNTVSTYNRGIYYNFANTDAGKWVIKDNTISVASAEGDNSQVWSGLYLQTYGSDGPNGVTPEVEFKDNTVDGTNPGGTYWSEFRAMRIRHVSNHDADPIAVITGNTFKNADYGVWVDDHVDVSGISLNNNIISGNSIAGVNDIHLESYSTNDLDAASNYWGDATGPESPANPMLGHGNAVSGNVDFNPWWADAAMTILAPNIVETGGAGLQDAIDNVLIGDLISVTNNASAGNVTVSNNVVLTTGSGVTAVIGSLTFSNGGSIQVVNGSVSVGGVILTGTFTLDEDWGTQAVKDLPFEDDFNAYAADTKVSDLGAFGWGGTDNVTVQSAETHEGSGAVDVPANGVISNRVNGAGVSALWADFQMKPVLRGDLDAPDAPADCSQVFYFNKDGYVVLHTASGWTVCSNSVAGVTVPQVTNSSDWARISVFNDYNRQKAALLLNGLVLAEEEDFSSSSVTYFSSLLVSNEENNAYLDDVYVGEAIPDGLRSETYSDEEDNGTGDGVDDAWEIDRYGSILANTATTVNVTIELEGAGGTVTPQGALTVPFGISTNVVFSTDSHHYIEDVTVEGASVGGFAGKKLKSGSYIWSDIARPSTLKVIVAPYRGSMFSF